MYSNNILTVQVSMTILDARTKKKKSGNSLKEPQYKQFNFSSEIFQYTNK